MAPATGVHDTVIVEVPGIDATEDGLALMVRAMTCGGGATTEGGVVGVMVGDSGHAVNELRAMAEVKTHAWVLVMGWHYIEESGCA
jgi:hypothetical protein